MKEEGPFALPFAAACRDQTVYLYNKAGRWWDFEVSDEDINNREKAGVDNDCLKNEEVRA